MISEYIQACLRQASYEILADDHSFYGEIPCCTGVYANAATLELCREELRDVLEGWLLLRLTQGLALPVVDGVNLVAPKVA
ncbi:MAG: hypothetical protein A2284_15700 [Deltaproteobacteria bacterium RIFOXYA12_FULL_61_11]|nr:MAG: hypothetical protein A2284_15700 [Deltaproteobacteria bacterium RIFOXYA12_FULL_61_11]